MSSFSPAKASDNVSRRKRLSKSTQSRKAASRRRHGLGSVTFQGEAAIIPEEGGLAGRQELSMREEDEEGGEGAPRRLWPFFRVFVENKYLQLSFRISAFFNVLSLIFSAPFVGCRESDEGRCDQLFVWFVVITCVDFVVSVVYTVQAIARIEYAVYLRVRKKDRLQPSSQLSQLQQSSHYTTWYRLINLILVTVALWWSVAIGIWRSIRTDSVGEDGVGANPIINPYLYLPFILRGMAVFTTIQLFLNVELPVSIKELLGNIKWKQLGYVTLFYLFFLYIYALMGVQWVGGLSHRCVYIDPDTNDSVLAIPITHCNPDGNNYEHMCYGGSNRDEIQCRESPDGSRPLNINFRNEGYFGQFRTIIDAMFAVYEASSLELWWFMANTAFDGAPTSFHLLAFYYFSMVFYLVIFVQQSIFLVVIIESFADLRSERAIGSAPKTRDKPLVVLTEQASATDLSDRLQLQTQRTEESAQFTKRLDKWYHGRVEKVFLVLVLLDAIITSFKYTDINEDFTIALKTWQFTVSFLFVCEVVGLVIFHLVNTNQYALLLRNPYYWYLGVLAVAGLVAAVPVQPFYDPSFPGNGFAIFQAARLPRLLRLFKEVKLFFFQIVGDGSKLLVIIVLTGVFLMFFAVINMQLFGYLDPPKECLDIGKGQFGNFFLALQAMFQLIMQEGWSEVMSEAMCHDKKWIAINFYFILLHLIASLILLNFFVAVILDNLDYDEDKKKEKLQQVVEKKTTRKVPRHLKLLTACGPKLISAPKISAAGVEVPNLTEADVKSFYETGEARDMKEAAAYSAEQPAFPRQHQQQMQQHQGTISSSTLQRQNSELSQLQLLSVDSSVSTVSSHFEKFQVIQGILESVRILRKQNRDQEGRRPGLEARGGGLFDYRSSQDTSQPVEDEYDLYRAKYRLFDSALFCMPPDHRLRCLCKTILTRQMGEPSLIKTRLTPINLVKQIFSYYGCYIVSRLPYFTWLLLVVTLSVIGVQINELRTEFRNTENRTDFSSDGAFKVEPSYIWVADLIFILFTLVDLSLKILANGFFLNPDAAIRSLWDVLDWVVVLSSLATMITYTVTCGTSCSQTVVFTHIPTWFQIILCLRAVRPLRVISIVPQMRRVIWDVVLGWKQFVLGGVLLLFSLFMFASLGVQLFAGDYPNGPQAFCNDPSRQTLEDCLRNPAAVLSVSTSRELLPNRLNPTIMVPSVWYTHRRDFSFEDTGHALLTMFEVLTLEGWLDVRDMLVQEDPTRPGIPNTREAWYMAIFLHIFIFFGVNIGLQLFVGIVVNNFNAHKPGNSALLTVSQKRWTDLVQRISLLRPIKRPPEPSHNRFRLFLYRIVISHTYRHISTATIICQSFCFCIPWNTGRGELPTRVIILMIPVIFFSAYFILEECVKLLAFGPKGFFSSWRNIADTLLSLLGMTYIIWAVAVLASNGRNSVPYLANFALLFTILRFFTILGRYSIMQNLSITVVRTLLSSIPLVCVLFFILLTYAFIGTLIFSDLRTGEGINFSRTNFDGTFASFSLVARVMTGEDWHHLLWDAMIGGHYCSEQEGNCGNVVAAVVWFLSYYVLITFILLNIVIAVLLENFSIFYNEDDTSLSHAIIKDFKQNWLHFDKKAQGTIKASQIKLFLRTLRLQKYYTYGLSENNGLKLKVRDQVPLLTDSLVLREMAEELQRGPRGVGGGERERERSELVKQASEDVEEEEDHSFHSVLKMLAYRAEDISQRLEPQELYDRQEFEESIQFDVAEECILKWIKRFVQPVLESHDAGQGTTEEHVRYLPRMDTLWPLEGDRGAGMTELSVDSDDEGEEDLSMAHSTNPTLLRKWLGSPSLPTSEDLPEPPSETREDQQSHEENLVAQSYSRLAQISFTPFTQGGGAGGEDRWHDWFRMQRQWNEQADSSNQTYFDDGL